MTTLIENGFVYLFENYNPFLVVSIGTFVLHELFYYGLYIPYVLADHIPALQKYKIQPDKKNTLDLQWNCFYKVFLVHVFADLPLMLLSHNVLESLGISRAPPFPTWSSMLGQVVFFHIVEDFYFYWIHRLLHWGPFYKYIHKVHHEHTAPFAIAGEYAHPLETLFLGLGTSLGPFLVRAHLLTIWVWMFFRVWQVLEVHSGYDFPWSFNHFVPLWGGAEFHDYHHMSFVGNYSSTFTLWDRVFGTDSKYRQWKGKTNEEVSKKEK